MNWEAFGYWALIVALLAILGYLELGFAARRQRAKHDRTVIDSRAVPVRCDDCGRTIALGMNVTTGDLIQHVTYGDIVAAVAAHRRVHHQEAVA